MMMVPLRFFQHVLKMPWPWLIWIFFLININMASVLFLPRLEAWVVLAAGSLGGLIQTVIFARLGYVKLLGIGHIQWIPMIFWLYTRFPTLNHDTLFFQWLVALVFFNTVSLTIDAADVTKFIRGQRKPTIVLP